MKHDSVIEVRKLGQQYAFASLQMHEAIARHAGFGATDHKYLGFFLQMGKLAAGDLAALTGLTTGAVTGLIDRFERKKLVKRLPDPADRRKVYLVPDTKKITALFAPYYTSFQKETDRLIASFSSAEIEVIKSYLVKAIDLARKTHKTINI